jgi:hypothetical protein
MQLIQGQRFMHQPLRMYPAQCVLQYNELPSIITYDHQGLAKTMIQQASEQRPFIVSPSFFL